MTKLILAEAQSEALRSTVDGAQLVSSDLLRTEVPRAIRRSAARSPASFHRSLLAEAAALLGRFGLIASTPDLLDAAGRLEGATLRSLDAIHVTAALSIAGDLDSFVTYDGRQADAARAAGLPLLQPGT